MVIRGIKQNMKKRKCFSGLIILMFLVIFYATAAHAHKVYLFAWTEGDTIYTESYFSGNKKIKNGTITVFNSEGEKLLSGKTNDVGEFSFKIPVIADLKIVLESSMGHGAEYLFKKSEFSSDPGPAEEKISIKKNVEPETPKQITAGQDQLRKEIEAVLDEKLKPVIRELARLREDKGPGITEIIGGIGYILGIMGIAAYMKSRQK